MATQFPEPAQPINSIEEEINQFFDRIVACVNYRRRALIAEANEKKEEKREKLKRNEQSEQQLLALKVDTERNLKENFLKETQERILKELEDKLAEVRLHQPETRLKFQRDSGHVEQLILGLGEIIEEELLVVPRYQDMKVTVAVGKKGMGDGEISHPHVIAIDQNTGNIYVAQGTGVIANSGRVSIYSESGEILNSFGQEYMNVPYGIAIHGNYVYVSDSANHIVFQFKQGTNISLVKSVGGQGSEDGKFNNPRQICISRKGDVYVADWLNHRIQILDSSLLFLRKISHQSLSIPRDIKLTEDEVYVLSDEDNHCIHVFSHNGEKMRSFIARGINQSVSLAYHFCLDADKNIIISDYRDHCIKVFSAEGALLHKIGEQGHEKGMFQYPKGIALTKDLKLVVVSNNENFGLQIFC